MNLIGFASFMFQNIHLGLIKLNVGFLSWSGVCSKEAVSVQLKSYHKRFSILLIILIPILPSRSFGNLRALKIISD